DARSGLVPHQCRSVLPHSEAPQRAAYRIAGSCAEQLLELGRPKLGRKLLERALLRVLVRAPPDKTGAVTEAASGHLIVADFDHEHRLQRLPLAGALRVPPAGTARRAAGEARRLDQGLQLLRERRPLG